MNGISGLPLKIVTIILLTATICIAIFSGKETEIFTFTRLAFSIDWKHILSCLPLNKNNINFPQLEKLMFLDL